MIGRRVNGEGPDDALIMGIGEYPGKDEARTGRPFSGKTGREIDRAFDGIRLPERHTIFWTNWIREWCGEDGEYTQADFDRDAPALEAEIRRVQPAIILAMGRHITRWLLGDVDLEECHGIAWKLPDGSPRRELFEAPETVAVVSLYNPAAGFRNPEISATIAYDLAQLESILDGRIAPRGLYDDPVPTPDYHELACLDDVHRALAAGGRIGTDTEGYPHATWSLQGSSAVGDGWIIRARQADLMAEAVALINAHPERYHFIFHNALHDLSMFRVFGIDTTRLSYDNTMIMAFVLQLEPQGLKPLCSHWYGMRMQHYDEIMGDASERLARDWLTSCLENEEDAYTTRCFDEFVRLTTTPYTDAKGKVRPGRRLTVAPALPKTALHKALERCLRSPRPRGLWD
ncbi:MAG TPA: uracil-DNA glycosylase family protein, partial [Thermoanaerobaculia bacterium]|nr:uracil-DNA glycosylase family protein [Thermoanaerobaculia bacterium]